MVHVFLWISNKAIDLTLKENQMSDATRQKLKVRSLKWCIQLETIECAFLSTFYAVYDILKFSFCAQKSENVTIHLWMYWAICCCVAFCCTLHCGSNIADIRHLKIKVFLNRKPQCHVTLCLPSGLPFAVRISTWRGLSRSTWLPAEFFGNLIIKNSR